MNTIQPTLYTSGAPINIIDDSSFVLRQIVDLLRNKYHDGIEIIDELEQHIQEFDRIEALLLNLQPQTSSDKAYINKRHIIVKRLSDKIHVTKVLAQDLLRQDKKLDKNIKWVTVDRPLLVKEFHNFIEMDLDAITQQINELHYGYRLNIALEQQDILPLREFMTNSSYLFWVISISRNNTSGSWKKFSNDYQLLYGNLDVPMLQSMEDLLCETNTEVSIDRFISALRKHGNQFPFPKTIISNSTTEATCQESISEEKRMQLTKIALDLVEKFSEATMREHLVAIYSWYAGYDKKNKEAMRKRADEWGVLVKERRALISDNKQELLQAKHEQAERIDQARRAIYFFYEQFVTMWRVGEATREILSQIDFPGKGRIRDFLNFVAPLDQANYYTVMGMDKNSEKKDYRPKIYDFMEMHLNILVYQSKERDEYINQQKQDSVK